MTVKDPKFIFIAKSYMPAKRAAVQAGFLASECSPITKSLKKCKVILISTSSSASIGRLRHVAFVPEENVVWVSGWSEGDHAQRAKKEIRLLVRK